jgi:RNA polymerase sigma factor (sigma-70 family)
VPVSDERLVKRIRAGSDEAFAALYERYQGRLLSFCRHMLGSQAEAEDALQQCFVNAYRDIMRDEKELRVRPWLYRIARNQCLTALRARRFDAELDPDQVSLRGLTEEVVERADLRDLLRDLACLPREQREALVLAELNDNSHAEVAEILGCDREKVKSLVFQARSSLIKSREARALPCAEVQRQLSVLRGGSLRRSELRRHLAECPACRAFREEVKRQRAALALVLPVAPSASLKLGAPAALAAAKSAAGAGVGGVAASGAAGSGAAGGSTAALAAKLGVSASALKGAVAAVAVTAAVGGAAGVELAEHRGADRAPAAPARTDAPGASAPASESGQTRSVRDARGSERAKPVSRHGRSSDVKEPRGAHERRGSAARGEHGAADRPHGRPGGPRGSGTPRGRGKLAIGRPRQIGKRLRPERLRKERPKRAPRPARPDRTGPAPSEPDAAGDSSALAPE